MNLYQLLGTAGVLLVILYVLPAVQLRAPLRSPGVPHLVAIAREQVAQPLGQVMGRQVDILVSAGFTLLGFAEGPQQPGKQTGVLYIAELLAPDRETSALVYGKSRTGMSGAPEFSADVEYATHFTNKGEVDTNTSTMLGYFIRSPLKLVFSFPDERDPIALYQLHRRLVERHGNRWQSRPEDPPATLDDALARLRTMWPQEMEQQAAKGLYVRAGTSAYRLTWYGAIRGVVMLGTPGKQIRAALLRRRASRLAAELRSLPEPAGG
jgi:hypothetical protein